MYYMNFFFYPFLESHVWIIMVYYSSNTTGFVLSFLLLNHLKVISADGDGTEELVSQL